MAVLSGTVLDYSANPVQRVVRVHRRDNGFVLGEVVSNATTGAWSFDTSGITAECYPVAFDCVDGATLGTTQTSWMNSTIGSTTFVEALGNTLTTVGNVVSTSANPPSLTGISTSALFDGSGDAVYLSGLKNLEIGTGDFTLEVFARPGALTGNNYRDIFNIAHSLGNLNIRYGNSGFGYKLQVTLLNTAVENVWSCARTQSGDANTWGLYCFERYNGVCRLYYGGAVQSINSGANPSTYPVTSFSGSSNISTVSAASITTSGNSWLGNIGPWRFLNRALYKGTNYSVPTEPWGQAFGAENALIMDRVKAA